MTSSAHYTMPPSRISRERSGHRDVSHFFVRSLPRRAQRLRQQRGRETGVFRCEPVRRENPSNAVAL